MKLNFKVILTMLSLIFTFIFFSQSIFSVDVEGSTIVGVVYDDFGYPVRNATIKIISSTFSKECNLYGGCYCYSPKCSYELDANSQGQFNTVTDNLKFETDYTCQNGVGPNINVSYLQSCAPLGGPSYVDDEFDYIQVFAKKDFGVIWDTVYNSSDVRYEIQNISACSVEFNCSKPLITGKIPNQYGRVNLTWVYNLTPHKDPFVLNYSWRIKGLNPSLVNYSIVDDLVYFTPLSDKFGMDYFALELRNEQNDLLGTQEVGLFINKTIPLFKGWNLFSLPLVENNSIMKVLNSLGNGNFGCGRATNNPYKCTPAAGDFEGIWRIVWTQDDNGNMVEFWPEDNYLNYDNQEFFTISPEKGYWIRMEEDANLTIDFR